MGKGIGTLIDDITFPILSGFTSDHLKCTSFGQGIKVYKTETSILKMLLGQVQYIHI